MATPCNQALCRGRKLFTLLVNGSFKQHSPLLTQWRSSQYGKKFVEPVFDKDVNREQILKDFKGKGFKAAPMYRTTLFNYDARLNLMISKIMIGGNKTLAREIMDEALEMIKRRQLESYHKATSEVEKNNIEVDPVKIAHQAIDNCKPIVVTTTVLRLNTAYPVPIPCTPARQERFAIKWIVDSSREKKGKMNKNLAYELLDAYQNKGRSVRKKIDMHQHCEKHKAYASYRWRMRH